MSAHRSTPVNRNELGELPLLTRSGHSVDYAVTLSIIIFTCCGTTIGTLVFETCHYESLEHPEWRNRVRKDSNRDVGDGDGRSTKTEPALYGAGWAIGFGQFGLLLLSQSSWQEAYTF